MTSVVAFILVVVAAQPEPIEVNDAVELVIAGYEKNWSLIGPFRATMTRTIENSDKGQQELVDAARSEEQDAEADVSATLVVTPQIYSTTQTLVSDGVRTRYDGSLVAPEESSDQYAITDGNLTYYDPRNKKATIWPDSQRVGAFRHPRSIAFPAENQTLPQLLSNSPPSSAQFVEVGGIRMLELICPSEKGTQWVLHFDPSRDFILTDAWKLKDNGLAGYAAKVEYEKVKTARGEAWFPRVGEQRVYWKDGVAIAVDFPDGWVQRVRFAVDKIEFDAKVSDSDFQIAFAPGTQVFNTVSGEQYTIPDPPVIPPRPISRYFIALNIVVILVLLLVAIYLRWGRARSVRATM